MFALDHVEVEALAFFFSCALGGAVLGLATAFSEVRVFSVFRPLRLSLEPEATRSAIVSGLLFVILFACWAFVSFSTFPNIQGPPLISLIFTVGLFFLPLVGPVVAVPVAMFMTASLCLVVRRNDLNGPPSGKGAA